MGGVPRPSTRWLYQGVRVSGRKKVVGCNQWFLRSLFAPGWYILLVGGVCASKGDGVN